MKMKSYETILEEEVETEIEKEEVETETSKPEFDPYKISIPLVQPERKA